MAAAEIREGRDVGQGIRKEFNNYLTQLDALGAKIFEIGQECERTRQKLQKYEVVKNTLESHADASEAEK